MLTRSTLLSKHTTSKVYLSGSNSYSFVHAFINALPFPLQIILVCQSIIPWGQTISSIIMELSHVVSCSRSPDKTAICLEGGCFIHLGLSSLFCKMSGEGQKMMMMVVMVTATSIRWTLTLYQAPSKQSKYMNSLKSCNSNVGRVLLLVSC